MKTLNVKSSKDLQAKTFLYGVGLDELGFAIGEGWD